MTVAITSWIDLALCRDNPGLFFDPEDETAAERDEREAKAKAICATCPVIRQCAADIEARPSKYGILRGRDRRRPAAPPTPRTQEGSLMKRLIRKLASIGAALTVLVIAAVHGQWAGAGIAAGFLVAWRIVFAISCRVWDRRPCFWCNGTGRCFGSNNDRWGKCWFGCDRGARPRRRDRKGFGA